MAGPVTTITEAPAGSGKSYARGAVFLVDEYLVDRKDTKHISNLPLKPQQIAERVAAKTGMYVEDVLERIVRIPQDIEADWRKDVKDGGSGPWDTFHDYPLDNCHIAIDEAHTVCGRHHSDNHKQKWMEFLGELRHRGATIEFITQDVKKLALEVEREAGRLYTLVSADQQRDPWFKVIVSDWYELKAKLTGRWRSKVWQIESRKAAGKWRVEETRAFPLSKDYWDLYDSYDAPKSGGLAAAEPPKREWQKRGWGSLLLWFAARNIDRVGPRVAMAGAVAWLCLGGYVWAFQQLLPAKRVKPSDRVSGNFVPAVPQRQRVSTPAKAVEARNASLETDRTYRAADAVVLEAAKPVWRVAGLDGDGIVLADGTRLFPGESLPDGSVLESVDFGRRGYQLVSKPGLQRIAKAPTAAGSPTISKSVSGMGSRPDQVRPLGATYRRADLLRSADGSGGVLPVPGGDVRSGDRPGADSGVVAGNPGSPVGDRR